MRIRLLIPILVVVGAACGGEPPVVKDVGTPGAKAAPGGGGVEVGCKGAPKVGNPASTLKLVTLNGARAEVAPGKVTLVDLWATWCEPCKKSFPKYQELYVKYKASGLEILAVSLDEDDKKAEVHSFPKAHGDAKFPVGWDTSKAVGKCFSPQSMPSAYIIDKKGVLRFIHTGYHDGEEREIEKEIKELL
jgi:thiol-disulfide isomerase/thioredoxin